MFLRPLLRKMVDVRLWSLVALTATPFVLLVLAWVLEGWVRN